VNRLLQVAGRSRVLPYAVFIAMLLCVPAVFTRVSFFTMSTGVQMCLIAIATLGFVLLFGFAGQISLGQAAFYGTGAYSSAILTGTYGVSPVLGVVVGVVVSAGIAFLVGRLILRVRGHYLALATLSFGLVVFYVAGQLPITGGTTGLPDIPKLAIGPIRFDDDLSFFYLAATVLVLLVLVADNLVRSPIGRSLRAVGDSETAAAASGVDVTGRKVLTFVIAAVLASIAGSLYAHWVGYVDPTTLDLLFSVELLVTATVGGARSVWGAPIGAAAIVSLTQGAREILPRVAPNVGGQFEIVVYGIVLVVFVLFLPRGIAGAGASLLARVRPSGTPPETGRRTTRASGEVAA